MPTQRVEASIVVLDSRELRRAGIVELLRPWAANQGLGVLARTPAAGLELLEEAVDLRLFVVSIGASSVGDKDVQQQLKILRALGGDIPIVVVADRDDAEEVIQALGLGVQGFLPTVTKTELALQALTFIVSGGSYFPPAAIRQMQQLQSPEAPPGRRGGEETEQEKTPGRSGSGGERSGAREAESCEAAGPPMTNRQREVLSLLCHGEPNKTIARKLGMTEATVKVHVRQIMRKLGATNRTQAALCAVDQERIVDMEVVRATPSMHEQRWYAAE